MRVALTAIGLLALLNVPGVGCAGIDVAVLSSAADRVSGGDALVQFSLAQGGPGPVGPFSVRLDGRDITNEFHAAGSKAVFLGLVRGLRIGTNRLTVKGADGQKASLKLTNYPIEGPIVSGPHLQPFVCQTTEWALPDGSSVGPPLDANCSISTRITYLYLSSQAHKLIPLASTTRLPDDLATTTTTTGATVNFIVRVETATLNRGVYQSAVLHDPVTESGPSPLQSPKGWNGVLLGIQGSGCTGGWYRQGVPLSVLDEEWLGQGYALFTNTLQNPSNSCNAFLAGETAMMSKEYFIKRYGVPNFSLAFGASGGAYTALQTIDAFPGVFDGLVVAQTFPDAVSIAISAMDAHLLRHYFVSRGPNDFGEAQQVAVSGYSGRRAWFDAANQAGRTDAVPNRPGIEGYSSAVFNPAVGPALRYDPERNPTGARPTIWEVARNIYGLDPSTKFALRVFDNVGVQYGLSALNAGVITTTQFLDLNANIGGFDRDNNFASSRTAGDKHAIIEAYRSGLQLSASDALSSVPILDLSGMIDEAANYHYQWFHFAVRERLGRTKHGSENFIMWRGDGTADERVQLRAFELMNQWVDGIKADHSAASPGEKSAAHKPSALMNGCWTSPQNFVAEEQRFDPPPDSACSAVPKSYAFPRYVAGGPLAADILKCALKPIDAHDYSAQFTRQELSRLRHIFPGGVCDWSRRSRYFQRLSVGRSYDPAPSRGGKD